MGYDVAGRSLAGGWVEVITDSTGLERLDREGFESSVIERRTHRRPLASTVDGRAVGAGYTDPAELERFLLQVHADHAAITRLEVIGTSIEGRPIHAMLISDNAAEDEDEPAVLFSGLHHAREVMTVEAVMDVIDRLTDLYGVDPLTTARVDAYQIWTVPAVNPDGLAWVFAEDDLWRKNLRNNDANSRITWKDGVDVNRNYVWGWGNQCQGSSSVGSSELYRGAFPLSEPETAAMVRLGRRIRPVFDVEYHSYGEDVFYSMGCDPAFSPTLSTIAGPDRAVARPIAEDYAARMDQADGGSGFDVAPFGNRVDGIGRDHQAHENGSIAFVTELNSLAEGGFQPDYAAWRDATLAGQRAAWGWLIDRIAGPAVGGNVVDAVSGLPIEADVSLDEMQLPDGRRLTSDPYHGRFHIIVVPGSYTLRVRAVGYREAVVPLVVSDVWQPLVVPLDPDGSSSLYRSSFEQPAEASLWSTGAIDDDADGGLWEWGSPNGTHTGDAVSGDLQLGAPGFDGTSGEGEHGFVTGNAPLAAIDDDDVDGGRTSLVSPGWDLGGRYAVTLSWRQWLRVGDADPADGLELELSTDDGQSWVAAESWGADADSTAALPRWVARSFVLDHAVAPGPATRLRFCAVDAGSDDVVEAAIDDVELRGFSLLDQGRVTGLRFESDTTRIVWEAVPGGSLALYEVARGDLASLATAGDRVELGGLVCLTQPEGVLQFDDEATPPPGSGWFYLTRFRLGFSDGDWGTGGAGLLRVGTCTSP
jgi:hypothetical protein